MRIREDALNGPIDKQESINLDGGGRRNRGGVNNDGSIEDRKSSQWEDNAASGIESS